jgi:hypothetical protein
MHKLHFQERADGSERATEQELSDRATHGHVRSGEESRTEQTTRAPDGFVVWLSFSRLAGAPRFPMPFPRAPRMRRQIERGLLEVLFRYTLLNKAEVLVER